MRILLDECVDARIKAAFAGHSVTTVSAAGWRSTDDESSIEFASRKFDVFVTVDRRVAYQLDPSNFVWVW